MNTQGGGNSGFGELLATSAVKMGVRAVIVDGTVRDAEALEAMALPVYARGLCPNGCNKDGAGEVGAIVACGGVAVRPGDVVIADRDGVTVVPLDDAPHVAQLAGGADGARRKATRRRSNAACSRVPKSTSRSAGSK